MLKRIFPTALFIAGATLFISPQAAQAGDCCILKTPVKGNIICVRATAALCKQSPNFVQFKPKLFCANPGKTPPSCVENKPRRKGEGDSLELSSKYLEVDVEELKKHLGEERE